MPTDWPAYLTQYHQQFAGITEELLARARDETGRTAYDVLARTAPADPGTVLDLACGSAPLGPALHSRARYLGVDVSSGELALARTRRPELALVAADALQLPMADRSVDVIVCSMALMLLRPLPVALAEISRVLRAGGRLLAIYPTGGWPTPSELRAILPMTIALRTAPRFPQHLTAAALKRGLHAAGITVTAQQTRKYQLPITTNSQAGQFIDGLYLPGVDPDRVSRAKRALMPSNGKPVDVPLHIAHLIATKGITQ